MKPLEIFSLIGVGALWGCTNPLIRRGSSSSSQPSKGILSTLAKFRDWQVWLPYAINQLGSLLYYVSLSRSDLSMAVPICNGLALVFSILTSYLLGERVDKPVRAIVGSTFVMIGVSICLHSR